MERNFIVRGLLVGAVGGLLAFVFARIFAEPQIQAAIDYESGRDAAQAALAGVKEAGDPALFSRAVQGNVGIGVGMILYGVAMGGLYSVAYVLACGRVGNVRPRTLALLVALAGFLGFYLIPFLKYPANPPAIGNPDTIKARSGLFLLMVFVGIAVMVAAVWLGQRLQPRFGTWNASLLVGLAAAVVLGVVMLLLPSLGHLHADVQAYGRHATETPLPLRDKQGQIVYPGFPADTLFDFRLYSIGTQLILWSAIGLCFAPLADRLFARAPAASLAV